MTFLRILETETGQIMLSIILGLGLAALFQQVCKDGSCIVVEGPPLDQVVGKVFVQDGKCYKYTATSTACKTVS